jgi:hypothetical protein
MLQKISINSPIQRASKNSTKKQYLAPSSTMDSVSFKGKIQREVPEYLLSTVKALFKNTNSREITNFKKPETSTLVLKKVTDYLRGNIEIQVPQKVAGETAYKLTRIKDSLRIDFKAKGENVSLVFKKTGGFLSRLLGLSKYELASCKNGSTIPTEQVLGMFHDHSYYMLNPSAARLSKTVSYL